MSEYIHEVVENRTLVITIDRPERKNAISRDMYVALAEALERADKDDTVRVVLLTGSDDCFTSGNDLADFANAALLQAEDNPIIRFLKALYAFEKPFVVAVNGIAVGIGTTMLLHSDLVYANQDASFMLPFVNLGLCPEYASSYLLPRIAGRAKASEWLLLGEAFTAEDAYESALINAVVDNPLSFAKTQCAKLEKQPPEALRNAKRLLKAPLNTQIENIMEKEIQAFSAGLAGKEFREAVTAFFEKREADFSAFK